MERFWSESFVGSFLRFQKAILSSSLFFNELFLNPFLEVPVLKTGVK